MRGNITRRGKASWQIKFDTGTVNGKRQTRYATVRGTYKDAQKELTRLLGAADGGALPDPTRMTIAEYVRQWVANVQGRSPKTVERYGELCERQVVPHLGFIQLQKLRPVDGQQWHAALLSGDRPLARRTVTHAHRLLSLALSGAVKNGTIARNVATVHRPPAPEQTEIEILSPEQIEDVLCKLSGHFLHPIVSLALDTGMRRGELLWLQWGDVDLGVPRYKSSVLLKRRDKGSGLKAPRRGAGAVPLRCSNAPLPC